MAWENGQWVPDTVDQFNATYGEGNLGTPDMYSGQYYDDWASGGNWYDNLGGTLSGIGSAIGGALSNPAFGAVAGGLLAGQKPSQVGTQTVTNAPWAAQQPYLMDMFAQAQQAQQGAQYMTPQEQSALGLMEQRALMGNPLNNMAQQTYGGILSGADSNPTLGMNNPYLSQAIGAAQKDVTDAYNLGTKADLSAAASRAGAFGIGNSAFEQMQARNQEGLARQLGNVSTNMRYADYGAQQGLFENDINRRQQIASQAPAMAQNDYNDLSQLYNVGQTARYDPYQNLGKYGSLIHGQYGSTTQTPLYQNKAQDILGGALTGVNIARQAGLLG